MILCNGRCGTRGQQKSGERRRAELALWKAATYDMRAVVPAAACSDRWIGTIKREGAVISVISVTIKREAAVSRVV